MAKTSNRIETEEYRTNKYRRVYDPFGRLFFGYFLFPPKICKPRVMKFASITEAQLIFFKKKVIKTWLQKGKITEGTLTPKGSDFR